MVKAESGKTAASFTLQAASETAKGRKPLQENS
jgi:hypothetical protein